MQKVTDLVNARIRTESKICHKHAKLTHYIKDLVTGESFCPLCKKENELDRRPPRPRRRPRRRRRRARRELGRQPARAPRREVRRDRPGRSAR